MSQVVLDKRTSESLIYTLDATRQLDAAETILACSGISADQGDLVFGQGAANQQELVMDDGTIVAPGKGLQVLISGGAIPPPRASFLCYIRPLVQTTLDGTNVYNQARELTVVMRLIDDPPV